jgi:hypothetical protein
MAGSAFEQHYNQVENVYNVNGDLILSKGSTAADLARQLASLRQEVARLPGMDPQSRETSLKAVDAAIEESRRPKPKGIEIQKHLDNAASVIEKSQGLAENGLKLAQTLFSIGKWVIGVLGFIQ